MLFARKSLSSFISGEVFAFRNSAREFQGQGLVPSAPITFGRRTDFPAANRASLGKLSSKGPCTPLGYQMKCPIPREAKFSPAFHEVSPSRLPLHSFCQTRRPIDSR